MLRRKIAYWLGDSGATYIFYVYDLEESIPDTAGVYIFTGYSEVIRNWHALYIGESNIVRQRVATHDLLTLAVDVGATHVHIKSIDSGRDVRRVIERDLIRKHDPALNKQFTTDNDG